jgi:hypothetical protein
MPDGLTASAGAAGPSEIELAIVTLPDCTDQL